MKPLKLLSTAALTVLLAGCGGGDGSSSDGGNPALSGNESASNEVQRHFSNGDFILSGFGIDVNGTTQGFISKQSVDAAGNVDSVKVAGQVTSPETPPSLFDFTSLSPLYRSNDGLQLGLFCTSKIAFEGTDQLLLSCADARLSQVRWAMRLKQEDVSGKLAKDYVRNADGRVINATWVHPATVFSSGSTAVTASFEAVTDMVVSSVTQTFFFSEPVGAGWCQSVPDQSYRLGVLLNADKTTSLFEVPGSTCSFSGLTAIATGSWRVTASSAGNVYNLTHPVSVTGASKWQPLFSGARTPTSRMGTIIQPCNDTWWCIAQEIKKGDTFETAQPHFNEAAVPALKSLSGF